MTHPQATTTQAQQSVSMAHSATQQASNETTVKSANESSIEKGKRSVAEWRRIYLNRRERLKESHEEREKLKKTLNAIESQEASTESAWRQEFLSDFGKQSKAIRDQLKQRTQWRLEADQTREMIDLLGPQVEWLQIHTALARAAWLNTKSASLAMKARQALTESAMHLAASDLGEQLSTVLPTLRNQIAADIYNDQGYMARFNADVSSKPGLALQIHLSNSMNLEIDQEITHRLHAAVGEAIINHLPSPSKAGERSEDENIQPLTYEIDPKELMSPVKLRQRIADAEARLAHIPDLGAIDNA